MPSDVKAAVRFEPTFKPSPHFISFGEMCRVPGVYRRVGVDSLRYLVFPCGNVIYLNKTGTGPVLASALGDHEGSYERVNERFIVE